MTLQFSLISPLQETVDTACLIIGVYENAMLTRAAEHIDKTSGGVIKRLMESGDITGKLASTTILFDSAGVVTRRILVMGLGSKQSFDAHCYYKVCLEAARALGQLPIDNAISYLSEVDVPGHDPIWRLRTAALASAYAAYDYTTTKSRDIANKSGKAPQHTELQKIVFAGNDEAHPGLIQARAIAEGVRFARELAHLPPNICNPAYIAQAAEQFAEQHKDKKVTCQVLGHEAMQRLGFGALLAVARGSANEPKLVVLEYRGGKDDTAPYALVGKGITFDSGGINLKPSAGLEEMKFDMGGAAGVLGTFVAAVKLGLQLNLVCVVPAVENMPDGNAYRPGDVVTSLSGRTIEVLNTDAEGRLILCDALTYTVQNYHPQALIDVATLTGACLVALGRHASGLMSKHDDLAEELLAAGNHTLDRAWRLPLWEDYQTQLDSAFADFANLGGKYAGAITAGCFLARFTEGVRWAHLDIAGTAWDESRKNRATGRPVPLLTQWLIDRAGY